MPGGQYAHGTAMMTGHLWSFRGRRQVMVGDCKWKGRRRGGEVYPGRYPRMRWGAIVAAVETRII